MGVLESLREKKSFVFHWSMKLEKIFSACLLVLFLTYHPGTIYFYLHYLRTQKIKKIKSSQFKCRCPVRSTTEKFSHVADVVPDTCKCLHWSFNALVNRLEGLWSLKCGRWKLWMLIDSRAALWGLVKGDDRDSRFSKYCKHTHLQPWH